jgi:hypothetical protein
MDCVDVVAANQLLSPECDAEMTQRPDALKVTAPLLNVQTDPAPVVTLIVGASPEVVVAVGV